MPRSHSTCSSIDSPRRSRRWRLPPAGSTRLRSQRESESTRRACARGSAIDSASSASASTRREIGTRSLTATFPLTTPPYASSSCRRGKSSLRPAPRELYSPRTAAPSFASASLRCGQSATLLRPPSDASDPSSAETSRVMSAAPTRTAAPPVADVVLRDGSTMRFRSPGRADGPGLLAFFRGLSDRSLYLRFHGHPSVDEQLIEPVLAPDWIERGALVGTKEDRVFADAGFETTRETVLGTAEVHLSLGATETLRTRVDERDHVGVVTSLEPFFEPKTLAVVGASPRSGTIGGELFRNVLRGEFAGVAYPVNRSGASVAGVRAYQSIAEIGEAVDLAVVCLPGPAVLDAAEEALEAGVRALCVVSAGFAEIGADGEIRQEKLLELVRGHGARLLGPNCLGIAVAAPRLNATFGPRGLPPGNVGFSSQSGALGLAVLERAAERRLGLSAFVSVGNKADISSNDLLEYWEDDPATDVVL